MSCWSSIFTARSTSWLRGPLLYTILGEATVGSAMNNERPDKVIVVILDVTFGWMRIKVPYGWGPVLGSDRKAFHSASPCLL